MRRLIAAYRLQRGGIGNYPASLSFARFLRDCCAVAVLLLFALCSATESLAQSTAPGVQIRNVARVDFALSGIARSISSSEAIVTVQAAPSKASIEILRFSATDANSTAGPTACAAGSGFVPLPAPQVAGVGGLNPLSVPLGDAPVVHAGDAVFVRLTDTDKNLDGARLDVVELRVAARGTGDSERLQLTETGPNTGVFAGYIPSRLVAGAAGASANCALDMLRDTVIDASYVDPTDATDVAQDSSLVDPSGLVFDSTSGAVVNGARVRLVVAGTGLPATVRGDDGVSSYPAELITGLAVTDSGGTRYTFPAGAFRFPLVAPGTYQLVVEPPAGYAAPSLAPPASLVSLPGAPFRIQPGSFGAVFTVLAPAGAALDVPVDPASGVLTLAKTVNLAAAALGDTVEFQLRVTNGDARAAARDVAIDDQLPQGMRLRDGSVRVNNQRSADPVRSADGRSLRFDLALIAPGQTATVRYVVDIVPAAGAREMINTARARAPNDVLSNIASARVTLREDFFASRGFILGRVQRGGCERGLPAGEGQANVRIYLENGRYAVTDAGGRFHFEDVTPGSHVVQVDTTTVPESLQLKVCDRNVRDAGRDYSRFVELRAGEMQQVNFALVERPAPVGSVTLALATEAMADEKYQHTLRVTASGLPVRNARLMVMLPDTLVPAQADAVLSQGVWSQPLGDLRAGEVRDITLLTQRRVSTATETAAAVAVRAVVMYDTVSASGQRTAPAINTLGAGAMDTAPDAVKLQDTVSTGTLGAWRVAVTPVVAAAGAPVSSKAVEPAIDVEKLPAEFLMLQPLAGSVPPIASIKVAIAHAYGTHIELRINGEMVSSLNFEGTETNAANTLHLSRWRGVDLRDGDNRLVASLIDPAGAVTGRIERIVHYGGGAVRAELVAEKSELSADGRQRPQIVLRLFDAYGQPARPGTRGIFSVESPYRSWWEVEQLDANPLLTAGAREPQFEVGADGLARLELEPTSQAGFAVFHLRFNERRDQELRVWLTPAARDFVLVGIASGTLAHNTVAANMQGLEGVPDDGVSNDGRVAFFAKGRIRGDYLLTMAYDSARDRDAARARLKGIVDPNQYYLLYGDGAEPRDEAASGKRLYLKLERRQFVALFGDYDTGFTVTELARYNRSLTGLKVDFGGERVAASAFAARTDLGVVRDQISGDGTSGLYRLSRAPIVVGSDKLRLETRDRFNAEKLLSARELSRFLDYRIDYDTGTLRFREPVPSRDGNFNPVTIVVEYETPGNGTETTSAGARVSVRGDDGRRELGATLVQDGSLSGDSRLVALDAKLQLSAATEWRAELAHSQSDDPVRAAQANAWLTELRHVDERLAARVYARSEDSGFGVGQQFEGLGGSRKIGADVRWQWRQNWSLQAQSFLQQSLDTEASRQLAQAEVRYQFEGLAVGLGLEHANDNDPGGAARRSDIINATGSIDLLGRKITLRGTVSAAISGNDASVDYPARSLIGLDYHLPRATTLFAEWEHGSGAALDTDMSRIGLRTQPFDRTQLVSSVSRSQTEYGPRVATTLGLNQGWQLTPEWSLEGGLEQSNTLRGAALTPQNPGLPLASGSLQDDFLAVFAGAQFHRDDWTLASRIERRSADTEQRWLATAGWYRAERGGHALSFAGQTERRDALLGEDSSSADLRFAWAYRPDSKRWIVLNRLDLRRDVREGGLSNYETLRLVDNLHANWQWNSKTQIGLQLGLKRQVTTYDSDRLGSTSALLAFDLRRDLSARFDAGLHLASTRNLTAGLSENQFGLDVGFAPVRNVWLSLGYNFRGFEERDFAAGRQQQQGPYLQLRLKLDQDTFKDLRLEVLRAPGQARSADTTPN